MNVETLAALQGAIQKWKNIADGTGVDSGAANCPLCVLFLIRKRSGPECLSCPVFQRTLLNRCRNTPYNDWLQVTRNQPRSEPRRAFTDEQKAVAREEMEFLIKLLPMETTQHGTQNNKA